VQQGATQRVAVVGVECLEKYIVREERRSKKAVLEDGVQRVTNPVFGYFVLLAIFVVVLRFWIV
jgi:hypothetical protein